MEKRGEEEQEKVHCKRSDGKGWRCSALAMKGHVLCERHHHQQLARQNKKKMPDSTALLLSPQNNEPSHKHKRKMEDRKAVKLPLKINEPSGENAHPLLRWLDDYLAEQKQGFISSKEKEESGHDKRENLRNIDQEEENAEAAEETSEMIMEQDKSAPTTIQRQGNLKSLGMPEEKEA